MHRTFSNRHDRLWSVVLLIVAVGLERLAWLALRSLTPAGVPVDHFGAAHEAAFRVALSLLVVAVPLALLTIALSTGASRRAAIAAGLWVTLPEWVIAFALDARLFQERFRIVWYRLMDVETAAHYPAELLRDAFTGRTTFSPSPHWLTEAGSSAWLPIDLYRVVFPSALLWFVLFSLLASAPRSRRRRARAPAVPQTIPRGEP